MMKKYFSALLIIVLLTTLCCCSKTTDKNSSNELSSKIINNEFQEDETISIDSSEFISTSSKNVESFEVVQNNVDSTSQKSISAFSKQNGVSSQIVQSDMKISSQIIQSDTEFSSKSMWDITSYVSTTKVKDMSKEEILFYIEDLLGEKLPKTVSLKSGVLTFTYEQKSKASPQRVGFSDITGEFDATETEAFLKNYSFGRKILANDSDFLNGKEIIPHEKYSEIMKNNPDAICYYAMRSLPNSYGYTIKSTSCFTLIYPKENGKYAIHIHGRFYNKYLLEGCLQIQEDGSGKITENPIF